MTNKKLGNSFEREFCELLYKRGWWVHNLQQNSSGQPADILAVRQGNAFLIDCKVCSGKGFPLSRMEVNQQLAMTMWQKFGNNDCYFAMKLLNADEIYMVSFNDLLKFRETGKTVMPNDTIQQVGITLNEWIIENEIHSK